MKSKKNRVLITGSAGFIGFHVCKLFLEKNYNVVGVDNLNSYYDVKLKRNRTRYLKEYKNFKFFKADICNKMILKNIFKKNKFDKVINLAAQAGVRYSIKNPDAYMKSNLIGFFNIIDLCKIYKISHLLYASTSSVYGLSNKRILSEEDEVDYPIQFYAATKRSNELIAHSYSYLYNLPTTGLRFFTVYGPWGRPDMALFIFTKNMIANKSIDVFNKGNHERDFTFIDDVARSVFKVSKEIPKKKKFLKNKYKPDESIAPFRILNIGNNKPIKLMKYIKSIEKNLNKVANKNYLPLQMGDIKRTLSNNKKIKKLINFRPNTPVQKGINRFINWYKEYYNV